MLDEIRAYVAQDLYPFPVRVTPPWDGDRSIKRKKRPLVKWGCFREAPASETDTKRWWDNGNPEGVGIPTEKLVVVDVDTEDPYATLDELGAQDWPDTRVVRTARGGLHVVFWAGDHEVRNSAGQVAPGVDVRARGGYVVVPPTPGWDVLVDSPIATVPLELVEAILASTKKAPAAPAPPRGPLDFTDSGMAARRVEKAQEGSRNDTLNREAFLLGALSNASSLSEGDDAALQNLLGGALWAGLERSEAEATIRSGWGAGMKAPPMRELSDRGNAKRLVDARRDVLRHAYGLGWLQWDGTYWRELPYGPIEDFGEVVKVLRERESTRKWAHSSEMYSRITAACNLARTDDRITINAEDLDNDPELLATPSGVVDLGACEVRPADSADLCTKITRVSVDLDAAAPRFDQFMLEVFPDSEIREHVRRFLGYSITGHSDEQKLHLWHGLGSNGKSILIRVMLHVLGSYAQTAAPELLIEKSHATHTTDRARLRGSRLVTTVETGEGRRWDMSTVKQLTGEDKICARFMHRNNVEFEATWAIIVATNHKPRILGYDRADWRRVLVIPFERTFDPGDPRLFEKLKEEGPAILGWLCRAARDYLADGDLKIPDRVRAAVEDYRREQDVVGEFLEERTELDPTGFLERKKLHAQYFEWCGESEYRHTRNAFYRIVGDREGWRPTVRRGIYGFAGHKMVSTLPSHVRRVK